MLGTTFLPTKIPTFGLLLGQKMSLTCYNTTGFYKMKYILPMLAVLRAFVTKVTFETENSFWYPSASSSSEKAIWQIKTTFTLLSFVPASRHAQDPRLYNIIIIQFSGGGGCLKSSLQPSHRACCLSSPHDHG